MSPRAAAPSDRFQRRAVRLPGKLRRAVPQQVRRVPPENVRLLDALQHLIRVPSTARSKHTDYIRSDPHFDEVHPSGKANPRFILSTVHGLNHFKMPILMNINP